MTCIFCHHIQSKAILLQTEHFKVVFDIDPVQTGHLLLISKEHYNSLTELLQSSVIGSSISNRNLFQF